MKIRKIFKFMLLLIAVGLLLFLLKIIVSEVVSTNLKLSQGNLWILTIIYWIELLPVLLIYDVVIIMIFSKISYWLKTWGQYAIRMKKLGTTLNIIRLNYYLLRLRRLLRLGWATYGGGSENPVWRGLSKLSLTQISVKFVRIIISVPMILAFLFACFTLGILRGDSSNYLNKVQEFLRDIIQIKVNLGDISVILSILLALVTILKIIFSSSKRDARKIIDKENSQYYNEVVLLYRKLMVWIDNHIYKLSENLNYVINCQDSIVETILQKEVPNYKALVGNHYYIAGDVDSFRFDETTNLTELREIITELLSDRLSKYTRILSEKRFDIWNFYLCDFYILKEDNMEEYFYTKQGMVSSFDKYHTNPYGFTQEQIEKHREEVAFRLSWYLYDDLERLYRMKRASDSLRKYFNPSWIDRFISRPFNKDK